MSSRITNLFRLALGATGGVVLAIAANRMWNLKTQHLVAIVVGITLVSLSMAFLHRFADFLLVSFLCSVPLASFTKTFFFTGWDYEAKFKGVMRYSGVVAISVPDILLAGMYILWFLHIFVDKTRSFPRLRKHDILPLLLVLAYFLSMPGSPQPKAVLFGIVFLMRNVLVYFYLTRNIERRHLSWIVGIFGLTVLPQAALAAFQYLTGRWLSLAWSRGVGEGVDTQYVVPGIEHISRAAGTTFDSHSFGLYMAMLVPFVFAATFDRRMPARYRTVWAAIFVIATMALVLSFSRSAWLSAAISLTICWAIYVLWGEKRILAPTAVLGIVTLVLSPWFVPLVYERFASAGSELLTSRFDQFPVAWAIWKDHFLFGFGVGNYMEALQTYNTTDALELPVHNVFLWVGAESGLFGVMCFFGIAISALSRVWKLIRRRREPTATLAVAVFGALLAYLIDGLTDPLFREPVVYLMYWVCVSLSVALTRIDAEVASLAPARAA